MSNAMPSMRKVSLHRSLYFLFIFILFLKRCVSLFINFPCPLYCGFLQLLYLKTNKIYNTAFLI